LVSTQNRTFLHEEGLPKKENQIEILLPVIKNLGIQNLKTIQIIKMIDGVNTENGEAFRALGPTPTLIVPDTDRDPSLEYLQKNQIILNWYPKIQAMKSSGIVEREEEIIPNQTFLSENHIAFLDIDSLFFEIERFKTERGWFNLNLPQDEIHALLCDQSWYRLLIPAEDLEFDSFEKIGLWQEIALALLKKYVERFYTFRKSEWELHLEYQHFSNCDPNMLVRDNQENGFYRILIDSSQIEIVTKIAELKTIIETKNLKPWEFRGMKAIWFPQHLYEPLLYIDQKIVEIFPTPLNKGEYRFIEDLKSFYEKEKDFFQGKELYIIRNLSSGRGIGFFEAGNFHPDFILWLVSENRQYIAFIDPKGIRNVGSTDPKIRFFDTIKEIQIRLGDPDVSLESFIISNTPSHVMKKLWGLTKKNMQEMHILFQSEDNTTYIETMLRDMVK